MNEWFYRYGLGDVALPGNINGGTKHAVLVLIQFLAQQFFFKGNCRDSLSRITSTHNLNTLSLANLYSEPSTSWQDAPAFDGRSVLGE